MTAITPAYAHAYQTVCLGRPSPSAPHYSFRLPKPKARYPFLPNDRSLSKELGHDYCGWAIYTDGGTRVVDGETVAGWGCDFPVITTEAHLAFSGARTHSNNTAEMTAMLSLFLVLHGPVSRDEQSCLFL